MIRIAGALALVLGFAISAQAQGGRAAGEQVASLLNYSGGGGAGFGGGGAGVSNFHTLPHTPPAHFVVATLAGNANDFVPSTFVPYKIAVAEGRLIVSATPESLGQFARDCDATTRTKAKLELVQDHYGYPVVRRR